MPKNAAATPEPEAPEPAEPDAPEQPPTEEVIDGVFVVKRVSQTGEISTEVMLNGRIQPTEVQTVLEMAVRSWRKQIGLA